MTTEQAGAVEHALWAALRTLEENAALNEKLAEVAGRRGRQRAVALYQRRYESSKTEAARLRELIGRISPALEELAEDEL